MNLNKLEEIAYAMLPKHRGTMRTFHLCAIYKKKRLVSLGFNKNITHPRVKEFNYHKNAKIHSELAAAIRGGKEDYSGHTLAVLRINRNNKIDNSKPCRGCTDLCEQLNFDSVIYTDENGNWINL